MLAQSGERIATHIGLSGVLFGATVLAAVTALPEVCTGLAVMRFGDYQLAVSGIFGGNAFLPVLFLVATLVSGQAVLPEAQSSDVYLTALAIPLTTVYVWGLIFRPPRQWLRMEARLDPRARPVRARHRRPGRREQGLTGRLAGTSGAGFPNAASRVRVPASPRRRWIGQTVRS